MIHSTKVHISLIANKSPLNLGLQPFNSDQVQDWAKRQGHDWSGQDAQQLTGFVNRNTYLVQVGLYHNRAWGCHSRASVAKHCHLCGNLWRSPTTTTVEPTIAARVAGSIRGSCKKQHTCRVAFSGGI